MGVIEDFVIEYEREVDFWEAAARLVRSRLEKELNESGLRAIVTSRAKSPDRLSVKLRQRDRDRHYESTSQIREDIPDLAGVRVALYFPGQTDEAERIIRSTLVVHHAKRFPETDARSASALSDEAPTLQRTPRFSGYGARHFRVYIPEASLNPDQLRYSSALVEVQVASVLMHAWSEVQHDLAYKPLNGVLSPSEHALLDQLNGLVLAGEIALEQLQSAGDARLSSEEAPFRDHFELAEYLRAQLADAGSEVTDATLGNVEVLFDFLDAEGYATVSSVKKYVSSLERDFEQRPVADQLADLMLSGNESRYDAYLRAMSEQRRSARRRWTAAEQRVGLDPEHISLGEFVAAWVLLETRIRELVDQGEDRLRPLPIQLRELRRRGLITHEQHAELEDLRALRNQVLHGKAVGYERSQLSDAAVRLRDLTETIGRDGAPDS